MDGVNAGRGIQGFHLPPLRPRQFRDLCCNFVPSPTLDGLRVLRQSGRRTVFAAEGPLLARLSTHTRSGEHQSV